MIDQSPTLLIYYFPILNKIALVQSRVFTDAHEPVYFYEFDEPEYDYIASNVQATISPETCGGTLVGLL